MRRCKPTGGGGGSGEIFSGERRRVGKINRVAREESARVINTFVATALTRIVEQRARESQQSRDRTQEMSLGPTAQE